MRLKSIPLKIILCGLLLNACENKNCSVDYIDFSGERAPFIHIVEGKENCVYLSGVTYGLKEQKVFPKEK